jgi:TM2 domain-containing membrane protein YozV
MVEAKCMKCVNHPDKDIAGACVYCGKLFCSECLIEVNGKMFCKNDIGNVVKEAKEQAATSVAIPAININNVNTNQNTNYNGGMAAYPYKSKIVAALICFFLGVFGIHRFYVGKYGTGILWLLTLGIGGFGVIIDFIAILIGGFRDKARMPLK